MTTILAVRDGKNCWMISDRCQSTDSERFPDSETKIFNVKGKLLGFSGMQHQIDFFLADVLHIDQSQITGKESFDKRNHFTERIEKSMKKYFEIFTDFDKKDYLRESILYATPSDILAFYGDLRATFLDHYRSGKYYFAAIGSGAEIATYSLAGMLEIAESIMDMDEVNIIDFMRASMDLAERYDLYTDNNYDVLEI